MYLGSSDSTHYNFFNFKLQLTPINSTIFLIPCVRIADYHSEQMSDTIQSIIPLNSPIPWNLNSTSRKYWLGLAAATNFYFPSQRHVICALTLIIKLISFMNMSMPASERGCIQFTAVLTSVSSHIQFTESCSLSTNAPRSDCPHITTTEKGFGGCPGEEAVAPSAGATRRQFERKQSEAPPWW